MCFLQSINNSRSGMRLSPGPVAGDRRRAAVHAVPGAGAPRVARLERRAALAFGGARVAGLLAPAPRVAGRPGPAAGRALSVARHFACAVLHCFLQGLESALTMQRARTIQISLLSSLLNVH